jgi:hypothetical protein
MDNRISESCMDTIKRTNLVARRLLVNPGMPWVDLQEQTLCLRREHEGQPCPSLVEFLQFLTILSLRSSKIFFSSVDVLMMTMINEMVSFREVMERRRRSFICDVTSSQIPGVIGPRYSMDRWDQLRQLHQFQTSLCPVRLQCVLSSRNMMMPSSTEQVGFFLRCVMHGSTPRLKLATMSPGIFCIFLRKLCANAAKSGQTDYLRYIRFFARSYGLNPMMLRKI